MIEFFTFSWIIKIIIIFILGISVLIQALTLMLSIYRSSSTSPRILENLLEIFILIEILVLSMMLGQVMDAYKSGFVVPTGAESIRIIIFIVILILVLLISIFNKKLSAFSVIAATAVSLPIIESLLEKAYPWLFVTALLFLLIRGVKISLASIKVIKSNISILSVVYAVDNLQTGVLFSDNDGQIILSNYQMQKLMIAITGKIFRNSKEFYKVLLSDHYKERYKKAAIEGRVAYLLPNGTAWIFNKTDLLLRMKNYTHISATDVSDIWKLTEKLQLQAHELADKSDELKDRIANLHILSKEKEIENAKVRAHNILGQRLTVMLRIIQNEHKIDYDLLTCLSKGLLAELKAEQDKVEAYDELRSIQQIFAAIDVDISFEGKLPDNSHHASLFIDIIREGSTNAVRHGFATQIKIMVEKTEESHKLTIINNGHIPTNPIILGSGIGQMKTRVLEQGGSLEIRYQPLFRLSILLPGGDQYV